MVFVEDPTYFLALDVLQADLGLSVQTFSAVDDKFEQKIVEEKEKMFVESKCDQRYWGMIYVIPNFQNPTGEYSKVSIIRPVL